MNLFRPVVFFLDLPVDCREELTRTSSEGNTSSVHDSYNREAGGLTFFAQ